MIIDELREIVRLTDRLPAKTPVRINIDDNTLLGVLLVTDLRISVSKGDPVELTIEMKHGGK